MSDKFYSIIINNPIFIETLFHLDKYEINTINSKKRSFIKKTTFNHIYDYIPILKEIFNDNNDISYFITETFENNAVIYEIKLNDNPLFKDYDYIYKFRFFICFLVDKNKINVLLKTNKINVNDINPINQTIIHMISNYLENDHINYVKNNIIEKEIKPLLTSFNHHSFVLNII